MGIKTGNKNSKRNYKKGNGPRCSNCVSLGLRGPARYGHYAPTCPRARQNPNIVLAGGSVSA